MIKSNLANSLLTANGDGAINLDKAELSRIISLVQSVVENSAANGYEALTRVK